MITLLVRQCGEAWLGHTHGQVGDEGRDVAGLHTPPVFGPHLGGGPDQSFCAVASVPPMHQ